MSVFEILNYLSTFLDRYDSINYDFANFTANCEIKNFIKLSNKYGHSKFIEDIPNVVRSCGRFRYENKINLNSYIKKLVYKDDDINLENNKETGAVNIVKEKLNERRKMKLEKSTKIAIKMKNENKKKNGEERKKITIGKPVHLNIKFNEIRNMTGKIYQLGLRIGNKNTTTMKKLKQTFKNLKFEESIKNKNSEYINQYVNLKLVGEIDRNNVMDSNIVEVELQTNTTAIQNGFWFYFLIIVKENEEMLVSEPFTLLSYKQLTKRKEKSFLKKQEEYMINNEESIFPYYFESMFYYNVENDQYKLKDTFTFGLNFCQERRNANKYNENGISNSVISNSVISNSIMVKKDENVELIKETEELVEDLKQFYPILSDIPNENSNIDIDIKQRSVSTTDYPVMNNYECLSPFSNNSDEIPSSNPNELLNNNSYDNTNDIRNNGYPSPSSIISDDITNNDKQSLLQSPLQYQSSILYPYNSNCESSYAVNRLLSLIYEQKIIMNELKRLDIELYNLDFMNNNDKNNIYNIMLIQRDLLLQKFEIGENEKEYLEEMIYNFKIKDFGLQKDEKFLYGLNSEMNNSQCIQINPEENIIHPRNSIFD